MNRPNSEDSTDSESQSSSNDSTTKGRALIEGVDYTVIYDGINLLFYPLKDFSAFYYNTEIYHKTSGQIEQYGVTEHLNVQKNKYISYAPYYPFGSAFDTTNYAIRITKITGIDATTPITFEEAPPDNIASYTDLVEGVDYTMEIDKLTVNFKPSCEMSYIIYYETYEKSTGTTFTEGFFHHSTEMSFHPLSQSEYYDEGSADTFGIRILAVKGYNFKDYEEIPDSESSIPEEESSSDNIEDSTSEENNT